MGITLPVRPGGDISAFDSDDISNDLDVSGLPLGTRVYNESLDTYFSLKLSTASLDPDVVLEVKGITGARWIAEIPATGTVESVTGGSVDNSDPTNPVVKAPNGWTRIDVGGDTDHVDISVAGETAYMIEVLAYITSNDATGSNLTIKPNNVATNQVFQESGGGDTTATADKGTGLYAGFTPNHGKCWTHFRMYLKTGTPRYVDGTYFYLTSVNAVVANEQYNGIWTDTATAITSVRIASDQVAGIGTGSFVLWRAIPIGA